MVMMKYLPLLMLVLATCWASNPLFEIASPEPLEKVIGIYELPTDVEPTNYLIKLTPHLDTKNKQSFIFDGHSEITLKVNQPTRTLVFHASQLLDLTLDKIHLTYKDETDKDKPLKTIKINEMVKEMDFVKLTLEKELEINNKWKDIKLTFDFTGPINDNFRGFYKSSYQKEKDRWLAATHFEPVSAREVFPCWDEPAIKSSFEIIIKSPTDYNALSNMDKKGDKDKEGFMTFVKTPKMSTYLVAFVVSDYQTKNETNKKFGIWTRPNANKDSTDFAFEIGPQILERLKEFTRINYGKETGMKMDQILIPDFRFGAMENFGLVTYRESELLYIDGETTTQDKQAIATTIAHVFSQQWFGNLVTCARWEYIWLNKGFATFLQYYITEKVVKDSDSWGLMDQFVVKNLQESAFIIDATTKTRPLNAQISAKTSGEIQSLFDDIAYNKGASIIRMMQQFLTDEIFNNGLNRYLKDNMYKSVIPDQLFTAIENTNDEKERDKIKKALPGKALKDVMYNWINKPGYPVVTVQKLEESENSKESEKAEKSKKVRLTQERFFLTKPTKQDTTEWYIPITYFTEEDIEVINSRWLKPEESITLNLKDQQWIILNKDQTGYYRVNYDAENWKLIAKYLNKVEEKEKEKENDKAKDKDKDKDEDEDKGKGKELFKTISITNRAALIDDALNLARGGSLPYNDALQITKYLSREDEYAPWYAAVRAFDYLDIVLEGADTYKIYHLYVAQKISKFFKSVYNTKIKDMTHVTKLAKVLALNTACKYGHENCEKFAKERLEKWLNDEEKDDKEKHDKKDDDEKGDDEEDKKHYWPDLRRGIICAGLRQGNVKTWDKVEAKYKNSKDKDEQADILSGLGCATSEEIVGKFLASTIKNDSTIDIFSAMNSIAAGNAKSFDILLTFINKNIEKIKDADKDNIKLSALLNKLGNKVRTVKQYTELSLALYGHLQEVDKFSGLTHAVENLVWINSYQKMVEEWIMENLEQDESNSASSFSLASFLVIIPVLLVRFN